MLKYLIYIAVGFLVYKIAKKGFRLLLSNFQQPKELNKPSELLKCSECNSYVSEGIAINKGELDFCSQDCLEKYQNRNSTP